MAVTAGGVVAVGGGRRGLRLVAIDEAPPPTSALPELARWIAPTQVPVRFDARYYANRMDGAPPHGGRRRGGRAWWASPRALLGAWESGDVLLYWPTHFTMRALAEAADAEELLAIRLVTREPDEDEFGRLPRSVFFQD